MYQCTSTTLLRLFSDATILDGLRSIAMQQCKQAVVDFHSNVFCCLWTSIDLVSRVWKLSRVDVHVCLATDSFWLEDQVSVPRP
jgi:hypothetical protein